MSKIIQNHKTELLRFLSQPEAKVLQDYLAEQLNYLHRALVQEDDLPKNRRIAGRIDAFTQVHDLREYLKSLNIDEERRRKNAELVGEKGRGITGSLAE